jgi:Mg2+/Co2+ transporter CorB
MGISINHIVSMSIPLAGGWLWIRCGHAAVFLAAAVIALVMLCFSLLLPRHTAPGN